MSSTASSDRYAEFREEIDRIDAELLTLLNRRARAGLAIGRLKREHDEPIYVPERERAVLERAVQANPGPLGAPAVEAIFRAIIAEIRALEEDE